jgi:hypothetical protein
MRARRPLFDSRLWTRVTSQRLGYSALQRWLGLTGFNRKDHQTIALSQHNSAALQCSNAHQPRPVANSPFVRRLRAPALLKEANARRIGSDELREPVGLEQGKLRTLLP